MIDAVTDKEAFEYSLRNLLEWLRILTLPPGELCDAWGNYNVAWELVSDLKADGNSTISLSSSYLTEEQKKKVADFLDSLSKIPEAVLVSATSIEANQEAMSHPCWTTYRASAAELIQELSSAAERNRKFFSADKP